jgi:hypothetical protein
MSRAYQRRGIAGGAWTVPLAAPGLTRGIVRTANALALTRTLGAVALEAAPSAPAPTVLTIRGSSLATAPPQ